MKKIPQWRFGPFSVAKAPLPHSGETTTWKKSKTQQNEHSLQVTYGATAYNIFLVEGVTL
jgi:hypothetical protein